MDFDASTEVIVKLGQEFITMIRRIDPSWSHAYWRFESEEFRYGSNASYESLAGIKLVDTLAETAVFNTLNELGRQLWLTEPEQKRRFCVCLLVVDSNFNYELKFERQDMARWRITKLNGASGRPAGLQVA